MYSVTYRLNAILTIAGSLFAVMCAVVATTDVFHRSAPVASLKIADVVAFQRFKGNDEVRQTRAQRRSPHRRIRRGTQPNADRPRPPERTPHAAVDGVQAILAFEVNADLRSCFSWNTKQLFAYIKVEYETPSHPRNEVTVWDYVIRDKEHAAFEAANLHSKYKLVDHGHGMRGTAANVTLAWNVMPYIGACETDRSVRPPTHPTTQPLDSACLSRSFDALIADTIYDLRFTITIYAPTQAGSRTTPSPFLPPSQQNIRALELRAWVSVWVTPIPLSCMYKKSMSSPWIGGMCWAGLSPRGG